MTKVEIEIMEAEFNLAKKRIEKLEQAVKTAIEVYKEYGIQKKQSCYKKALELVGEPCDNCDADGYLIESCCGDNIKGNDIDLCPTCFEHCGMEEYECDECEGIGYKDPK